MFFLTWTLKQHPVDQSESLNSEVNIVGLETPKEKRVWTLAVSMGCVDSCSVQKHERILHEFAETDENLHYQASHLELRRQLAL